ncbi:MULTISPECIES: DUF5984 family protein [Paenibacillus]|uniref:DUF5984 family protein n=1 Tax=Paenibacillus TaxID=44249 RepID=UPI002FE34969
MIQYQLKNWKDIVPWRDGNNPMLHWFALTDSHYWFNFKGVEFPKYSDEIIKEWEPEDDSKFVDYQFARIFWDICEVIRHVEIPVPNELFQKINSLGKLKEYIQSLKAWIELAWDESDEQFDEVYEVARGWLYCRRLDFGYLTGGPDCFLIRNEDQLHIYWFAEYENDKGVSLWASPKGTFSCNYSEFIEGLVKSFKAFGLDMHKQISALLESNPKDLEIDREQILTNQIQYEELVSAFENKKLLYADTPDWNIVLNKMNEISKQMESRF